MTQKSNNDSPSIDGGKREKEKPESKRGETSAIPQTDEAVGVEAKREKVDTPVDVNEEYFGPWFSGEYPCEGSADDAEGLGEGVAFGYGDAVSFDKDFSLIKESEIKSNEELRANASAAYCAMTRDGWMSDVVRREGGDFRQQTLSPKGKAVGEGVYRTLKPVKEGASANYGERFAHSRGRGAHYTLSVKEHGFYVQLRPTQSTELASLVEEIQQDRASLGRSSFGLLGSAISVATRDKVTEFAIHHIVRTNIKDFEVSVASLSELLTINGLNELVFGIMNSTHNRGIQYTRQCVNDEEGCRNSKKGVLNISRLRITDNNAFSEKSYDMIFGSGKRSITLEEVKNYRSTLNIASKKTYDLKSLGVKITLEVPSLEKTSRIGYKWVSSVIDQGIKASLPGETAKEKEERIERFMNIQKAGQLLPYITRIEDTRGAAGVATSEGDIASVVKFLSGEASFFKELKESVSDLLKQSAVSVFGVNEYQCEACNTPNIDTDDESSEGFIALDMVACFLLLCYRGWEKSTAP